MTPELPIEHLKGITDLFSLERNAVSVGSAHGFFCGREYPSTIQLVENVDIQNGGWLIHSITNRRYYAEKTEPISIQGKIISWMVKYKNESEYRESQKNQPFTNISIGTGKRPVYYWQPTECNISFRNKR